ncbi:Uncharacterized protein HZ326_16431 [Fusarium oxysporum f. sp. albedinis]|nr:Uncharacterized protein HZ326_16431 [Fusarium oxysporum f. sp. albedinis]
MLYKQFPIRVSCNACLYCIVALSPSRDSMKTSLDCAREEGRIPGTFRIYGIIIFALRFASMPIAESQDKPHLEWSIGLQHYAVCFTCYI